MTSLRERIHKLVHQVLDSYHGAWLTWCDPRKDWQPLLQRVASDTKLGGFTLVNVEEKTADELGGPSIRCEIQAKLEAGESFVLHVAASSDSLGWLWAQCLRAERIYTKSLREQLLEWGWRPHSLTLGDDDLAVLARQGFDQDPAEWGGGGLQPDLALLLDVLASGVDPDQDQKLLLDLTIEQAGLPQLDMANLQRWRIKALARLLVTQAHNLAPELIPETHEMLIASDRRLLALRTLAHWTDSVRLRRGMTQAIMEADRIASLGSFMEGATAAHGPYLSYATENGVFASVCKRLAQYSGKDLLETMASMEDDLARHAQGFWGDECEHPRAIPWGDLLRLSRAAGVLLDASPARDWANPEGAVSWYVSGGWRLDQAGEEFLRTVDRPAPEILGLLGPLRDAYRARWERYMIMWSEVWENAGCPTPRLGTSGEWAAELLQGQRATAIMFVDALRYDLGCSLAARINGLEGTQRATVAPARAPSPSITALGMGMALPIPEGELQASVVEGKWQLLHTQSEMSLNSATQRRAWLQSRCGVPGDAFLTLASLQSGEIPPPTSQRTRLIIADDTIDQLGHADQLEALGGTAALDRYVAMIARLRDAGWLRILVVTDHGFIYWPNSGEKSAMPPAPEPAYLSRRAAAYPSDTPFAGPRVLAPGGRWCVSVPRGAASFRAYGGLGYFHGGASLQEWIIPCIKVEWPLLARPVMVEILPLEQVLGLRPRVTLQVVRSSLLIEESIPRQIDVVIRDARLRTILFRSDPVQVTPDKDKVIVTLQAVEEAEAERGTSLLIEVRDKRDDETIATGASTLMTEMTGW